MKFCPKCNKNRRDTSFYKAKAQADGLSSYCKDCLNKYQKEVRTPKPRPRKYSIKKVRNGLYAVREKGWAVEMFTTMQEAKDFVYGKKPEEPQVLEPSVTERVLEALEQDGDTSLVGGLGIDV